MALDEFLFGKIANYFKQRKMAKDELVSRTVYLKNIRSKLVILSRAFTGDQIDIYPAQEEGGYKSTNFFLPEKCSLFSTKELNQYFYYFRILYLAEQRILGFSLTENEPNLSAEEYLDLSSSHSVHILNQLNEKYPVCKQLHEAFITELENNYETPMKHWLYGKLMQNDNSFEQNELLKHIDNKTKPALAKPIQPTTIINAKAVEEIKSITIDKKQQEDYVLTHNFEKVETAEEFSGVWRDFDGDDDLKDHQEALDELNMKFTVRVDDEVHSVYQAEFIENATVAESGVSEEIGACISYPEWDYKKREYKEDFCKLYPIKNKKNDADYYNSTILKNKVLLTGLKKKLVNLENKRMQINRLTNGNEFDIDALTDRFVDIASKRTPSEKVYIDSRKKEKDISILLLLDLSLSSDGYAAGNRVIDVEKEVAILFGEILEEHQIDFCISGFYSKTRNYSSFVTLKDFDDTWNKSKYRIGSVEPQGYTRIGTALRHAGSLLNERTTQNKWIILLSDGKPNDFDKYEGKYGINDTKQAIRELNQNRIQSYALAIEAQAKYYLPQMFGQNHYQILTTPIELLSFMSVLFNKIKNNI